jgi:hypothetical protein
MDYGVPMMLARVEYPDGQPDPIFQPNGEWAVLRTCLSGNGSVPADDMAEVEARAEMARRNRPARIPFDQLDVNRLSEQFYRDHGATHIERGLDAQSDLHGERVLLSSYCLRRELGECLREGSKLRDPLYIEHGAFRYRLEFDCKRCQMNLIYEE